MSQLEDFLPTLEPKIEINSVHLCLEMKDGWLYDLWAVTLSYKDNKFKTEYRTGLGHRKPVKGSGLKKDIKGLWNTDGWGGGHYNLTDKQAADKGLLKEQPPTLADVLSCLLSDASGAEETFGGWCSNFGYDTDSRKALDIYLKCQATNDALSQMFGCELFNKLSALEH